MRNPAVAYRPLLFPWPTIMAFFQEFFEGIKSVVRQISIAMLIFLFPRGDTLTFVTGMLLCLFGV